MDKNEEKPENKKKMSKKMKITIILIIVIIGVITVGAVVGNIIYEKNYQKKIMEEKKRELTCSGSGGFITPCKPIIYLYPKTVTELSIKLGKPENVTCSYPEYKDGWNVIANTDGTLTDTNTGRKLYSLYWEGTDHAQVNLEEGFIVKGSEVVEFLEEKLSILGLNEIEAEEFIIYWLPKLQENEYNFIRFATIDEINQIMPLEFSIEPDTIIRVLMEYRALDEYIEINEQKLDTPERDGFVVVEWGGTEIK